MRTVCDVTGKRGFTNGGYRLTDLSLKLGIFVQECLKRLNFLTHPLQMDQKTRIGRVGWHSLVLRPTYPSQQSTSSLHIADGEPEPIEQPPDCV